jgi:MFS family permease
MLSILLIFLVKEKRQPVSTLGRGNFFSFFNYWKIANPEFKKTIPGLLLFALFNSSDVFLLLITKETIGAQTITVFGKLFNADTITIAAYVFYNLVYAAASYPLGVLADKLGIKKTVIAGFILYTIVYSGFALSPSISLIFILFALYGIFAAATEGVIKAWITNMAHNQNTATAVGFYTSCESIAALMASIIGGALWTYAGSSYTFIIPSIAAIIAVCYLLAIKK